ncbi:radical SAM protein [Desulfurobacterium atlanticum]|uniref:FeMo cofactor biosynthesis protein NifB n=1 Tax=Desulfurobacterium atlanticum TaxID=240169 RepID=A0A238YRB8_9BACT|nr:radical SAM protein [Desulfurobacterium atlanticum]SNR73143.1 nitrogen fixation protein NifB [Desulfurobacterium atlanticum]
MKHPCFSKSHESGRIHLPVAKECNLGCNFCNRKYDCLNESRPGVTSRLLTPKEALLRFAFYREILGNISVAGIAGPGEPLANQKETRATFTLIKQVYPDVNLCLSTNGINLLESVKWLSSVGVGFVTVTINGISEDIVEKVYSFVVKDGKVYKGGEMAKVIIKSQMDGLKALLTYGFNVKVNIVLIPGINDFHICEMLEELKKLGVSYVNIIPLIPVKGTVFWERGVRKPPLKRQLLKVRERAKEIGLKIMTHCKSCRADAVGVPGKEHEFKGRFIAVTSSDGVTVDSHFGSFKKVFLFDSLTGKFCGVREVNGTYNQLFLNDFGVITDVFRVFKNCGVVITKRVGKFPETLLKECGISVVQTEGSVREAVMEEVLKRNYFSRFTGLKFSWEVCRDV